MKDDRAKLEKILECIQRIQEYIKEGKDLFLVDYKTQDAVIRNCQVIGEAVKGLSAELQANTPTVGWRQAARFRDKITHDYFEVDLEKVWEVAEQDLLIFGKHVETVCKHLSQKVEDVPQQPTLAEKLKAQDSKQPASDNSE